MFYAVEVHSIYWGVPLLVSRTRLQIFSHQRVPLIEPQTPYFATIPPIFVEYGLHLHKNSDCSASCPKKASEGPLSSSKACMHFGSTGQSLHSRISGSDTAPSQQRHHHNRTFFPELMPIVCDLIQIGMLSPRSRKRRKQTETVTCRDGCPPRLSALPSNST